MTVILASGSPRRRELIRLLFADVEIHPADVSEEAGRYQTPAEYALSMASRKAQFVSRRFSQPVLGADTVVSLGARIFGKPAGPAENIAMLRELSGKWHAVITAIALWEKGVVVAEDVVTTKVLFASMNNQEIADYVRSGEGLDKAGGYGIQGLAGKFVAGIDGCYYNVVGLPVAAVARLFKAKK
ncbi:MAG: Maf family protein [Eubacteriales bacterium]|jgi:septum formation protein|nr:Maf family protein [Eubacteriales bacterium]